MFFPFKRQSSSHQPATGTGNTAQTPNAKADVEKLKEAHDIAQTALQRAITADENGDARSATTLYALAVDACDEGLRISTPSSWLGSSFDNTAAWQSHLDQWRGLAADRLHELRSSGAAASRNVPPRSAVQPRTVKSLPSSTTTSLATAAAAKQSLPAARATPQASKDALATYRKLIETEILDATPTVAWDDIAGLQLAKQSLFEAVVLPSRRPDLFSGLRSPARGLLLYGPPGNGKTMLAKALAHEAQATFFSISASSLTSKWMGDAEKLMRALFAVAAERAPSVVFIDEIDSILSSRASGEHEASRRLKTEFLVQFDGVAECGAHTVVIGATNRPQELDDAVRRRLVKRIYIPLPDAKARQAIITHLLRGQQHNVGRNDMRCLVDATANYSASDLTALCKEAAMLPLRELPPSQLARMPASALRPLSLQDFMAALQTIKPSVSLHQIAEYESWTQQFGTSASGS